MIALGSVFRNVFIVESRDGWSTVQPDYDPANDLVLTYDFALRRYVEELGGTAYYVDHLCEQSLMQENNFLMYQFFREWHFDANGKDIFQYREVDFGFSFRIEIWNDFTFYVRSRLCMEQLRGIRFQALYVDSKLDILKEVLGDIGLTFIPLESQSSVPSPHAIYFFPIHLWMNERLRIRRLRHVIRDILILVQGFSMSMLDRLIDCFFNRKRIFIQEYHPSRKLMFHLQRFPGIQVVQGHFSAQKGIKKFLRDRPIPVFGKLQKYRDKAAQLVDVFRHRRLAHLVLTNGIDVTEPVYRAIERRIAEVLPKSLQALDSVIRYLDRHPIHLEILIANLGQLAMIVDCVAKSRGVPSYMIINGLLGNDYLDEAKYATVINAYSTSIRDHYFRGMDNIVCLGDPRMDAYTKLPARLINRKFPTITIGTSGFNNIDLNSFLAVEFEFLHEVLTAILNQCNMGRKFKIVLKVRANGYREQYRKFTEEYFPGLVDRIVDDVPMLTVLDETDFFITIYSQTLFEASCMGIPVVYHKCDSEIMDPPFDGKSELVTTFDVPELEEALADFLSGSTRFDAFLNKKIMEKYIGPLDGKNFDRNICFVYELLFNKDEFSNPHLGKGLFSEIEAAINKHLP